MDTEQNRSAEQCLYASTVLVFFISPLIPPRFSCSQRCISCWKPTGARACCSVEISSYIRRMPVYPVAPSGCLGQRQRDLRPLFPSLSIFLVGFDARPRFVPSISYLLSLFLSRPEMVRGFHKLHNSHRYGRTAELPLTFIPVIVSSRRKSRCFNSSFFQLEFLRDLYSANTIPARLARRVYISVESVKQA